MTKNRLARLVPAVERALRDCAVRQARREADELSHQRGRELDSLAGEPVLVEFMYPSAEGNR